MPSEKDNLLMEILSLQRELNRCATVAETAPIILDMALHLCRMDGGSVYLRQTACYRCIACRDNPVPNHSTGSELSIDQPLLQAMLTTDRPGKLHNITEFLTVTDKPPPYRHVCSILLRTAHEVIGLLNLGRLRDEPMADHERRTLTMLLREAETVLGRICAEQERIQLYRELENRVIERTNELQNRIKELHGLHGFSNLSEQPDNTLPAILHGLTELLRDSMQYSDMAAVHIELDQIVYETTGYQPSVWSIEEPILVFSKTCGVIQIAYKEKRFSNESDAFTEGEKALLRTTALRLGRLIERERITEALKKSEQQYRDLFARLSIPALLCNLSSLRIVDFNVAAQALFHAQSSDLIGRDLFDLCPQKTFLWNPERIEECRRSAGEHSYHVEGRLKDQFGRSIDVILDASCITIDGNPFLFILLKDVTEQNRALFQKEALNKMSAVFSASDDLDETIQQLVHYLSNALADTDVAIALFDHEKQRHRVQASNKFITIPLQASFGVDLTFSGNAAASESPVWYRDVQEHPEFKDRLLYQQGARSVLSIPIMAQGQALGAVTLFTRERSDDLQTLTPALQPLATTLAGEIQRKQAEQHIRRHDAILEAINYAAQQFINRPFNRADIEKVLAILGYAANVDRVYIFENHLNAEHQLCMSQRYEWCAQGNAPQIDNPDLQNITYEQTCPRWAGILAREETVHGNVADFPKEEQRILTPQNILSLAVVPVFSSATWWGFIGFDDCKRQRTWQIMELEALKTAADVVGASVSRQKSEEALRHSEAQLRAMYEKSLDIILIIDPDSGKILRANESTFRLLGYEPEQLVGETLDFLFPNNTRMAIPNLRELADEKNICLTQKFVRFDGGICSMDFRAITIPWEEGYAIFATLRDVTDREYAEEILKRNEERFRRIFEETPVSLWERDYSRVLHYLGTLQQRGVSDFELHFKENPGDLRWCLRLISILDVNNISLDMFKARSKEELIKRHTEIYGTDLENNLSAEICALARQSKNLNIECLHHTLDGQNLNLIMRWTVIPGYEASYRRVLVSYVDITPQRTAEREARLRREQLIQADKMIALGTLVAGVAHEINNPNSFVTLNAPLLANAWKKAKPILDDYYRQHGDFDFGIGTYSETHDEVEILLNDILEGAHRIRTIVKDLKNFARQNPAEALEMVQLNDTVQSVCALLRNSINKATGHLEISCKEGIPPVHANKQRLEQVLVNLIINACQSLPDRLHGIRISTGHDSIRNEVFISIQDDGCGIPDEQLSRILDPFYTTKRDTGGTGLGLSISSTIMEEHGGRLQFESELNRGTTATMILPVHATTPNSHSSVNTP